MVRRSIDQKLRLRNFDARIERIGTGAVVKCLRWLSGIQRGKRVCNEWTAKGSVQKEIFTTVMRVQHRHQKPLHPLYIVTFGIVPNVNSISLNRSVKFGTECSFRHWKVEEQPHRRPKTGGDRSAAATVKDARQLSCVPQDVEPPESAAISGKGIKNLGTKSTSTIRKSCAVSSKDPRQQRTVAWGKFKSNFLISTAPTLWNLRTNLRWKQKDKSDAPAETRGDLPRMSTSSKGKSYILFAYPWVEFARRIHNKARRKRVCGGLRSKHAHVQQEKALTLPNSKHTGSQKSATTAVAANVEMQTKEEATVYVRELDLFVTVMLLKNTPAVLSLGKLCENHGYSYHWTSGQKTTSHQK